MRLLNAETLEFTEFFDKDVPRYFILSHRWSDDEISYKDFAKGRRTTSIGYQKIRAFCKWARVQAAKVHELEMRQIMEWEENERRGLEMPEWREIIFTQSVVEKYKSAMSTRTKCWVWIDTCCIDKKSSAELSLAINSMYQWYQNAFLCCVVLTDVTSRNQLIESDWFKRGWTLQELLAPEDVIFVNRDWTLLGHRCREALHFKHGDEFDCGVSFCQLKGLVVGPDLNSDIEKATGIPIQYLSFVFENEKPTVAQRLSWASRRSTTRKEDEAYCLLGLLDVNMPLLYGEGANAFARLQEEIIKQSNDHSIFAWRLPREDGMLSTGVLAHSPKYFINSENITKSTSKTMWPFSLTNSGLRWQNMAREVSLHRDVRYLDEAETIFALPLGCRDKGGQVYLILGADSHHDAGGPNPQIFHRWQLCIGEDGLEASGYIDRGDLGLREFLVQTGGTLIFLQDFESAVRRLSRPKKGECSR